MSDKVQLKDPTLLLTPHPSFKCSERIHASNNDFDKELLVDFDEEEIGRIKFSCTIPHNKNSSTQKTDIDHDDDDKVSVLHFRCRDQSVGFLNSNENSASSDDGDTKNNLDSVHEVVDPNFFDSGYTLAGRTGFQIWAGSRVMMEGLIPWWIDDTSYGDDKNRCCCQLVQNVSAWDKLKYYQEFISNGAKILELGSGVGVVGTSLAAIGGQVLLTDLPTLVDYSLWPNLIINSSNGGNKTAITSTDDHAPSWLGKDALRIHNSGWASTTSMDWSKPLKSQLSQEQIDEIEIIISCDCVWLVSMLDGLLDSVSSVFESTKAKDVSFLMSFQRRDTKDGSQSSTFTTVDRVLSSVEERGWKLDCLAWRPVTVRGEDNWKQEKDVFVFEIKP